MRRCQVKPTCHTCRPAPKCPKPCYYRPPAGQCYSYTPAQPNNTYPPGSTWLGGGNSGDPLTRPTQPEPVVVVSGSATVGDTRPEDNPLYVEPELKPQEPIKPDDPIPEIDPDNPYGVGKDPMEPFMKLLNEERKRLGCQPLTMSPFLAIAALRHSKDMKNRNFFAHAAPEPSPNGKFPKDRMASAGFTPPVGGTTENIAGGVKSPEGLYEQWKKSPPHYASMTDCKYKSIGIGLEGGIATGKFASTTDAESTSGDAPIE